MDVFLQYSKQYQIDLYMRAHCSTMRENHWRRQWLRQCERTKNYYWWMDIWAHDLYLDSWPIPTVVAADPLQLISHTKPYKESINYFVPPTSGGHNCCVTRPHTTINKDENAYFLTPVDHLQIALTLLSWAEWGKQCLDNTPRVWFYIIDVANLITRCAIVAFTDDSNVAIVTAEIDFTPTLGP